MHCGWGILHFILCEAEAEPWFLHLIERINWTWFSSLVIISLDVEGLWQKNDSNNKLYWILSYVCIVAGYSSTVKSFYWATPNIQQKMEDLSVKNPQNQAGFLSSLTFSWMTGILKLGYKQPLEDKHLWASLWVPTVFVFFAIFLQILIDVFFWNIFIYRIEMGKTFIQCYSQLINISLQ